MSYGIKTKNKFQGVFLSEKKIEVVYATGKATVTDSVVHGFGSWFESFKPTFLLCKVTLTKLINQNMIMRKSDPRNPAWNDEEGLLIPELAIVAGSLSGRSWGTVGGLSYNDYLNTINGSHRYCKWVETEKEITMFFLVSSSNEASWRSSVSTMSDTIYVMITGTIPSSQKIPDYGMIMRNSKNEITFNSNYMPVNPSGFLNYPSSPSDYKSTPSFISSGILNSGPLMHPVVNIGHGVNTNNWNANIGICFSSDFSRYGARVNGFAGSIPNTKAYNHLNMPSVAKFPIYKTSDYF
ncbi:TPA: hypothetical protein ACGF19_003647 [Vibrio cholerae]